MASIRQGKAEVFMPVKKKQKAKSVQEIVTSETESQRCVLVGTYKKKTDQLKWIGKRHLYNYPLSTEEAKTGADGWGKVKELWLYSGSKDRRRITPQNLSVSSLARNSLQNTPIIRRVRTRTAISTPFSASSTNTSRRLKIPRLLRVLRISRSGHRRLRKPSRRTKRGANSVACSIIFPPNSRRSRTASSVFAKRHCNWISGRR